MQDFYKILQVRRDASMQEIKKAFRTLAKKYHPDKNPNNPKAAEIFKTLNDAYMLLSDVQKRKAYKEVQIFFKMKSNLYETMKMRILLLTFFKPTMHLKIFLDLIWRKGSEKTSPKALFNL